MMIKGIALSIRQPLADLIVRGIKTVENRTWATAIRGEFYIHASKTFDEVAYDRLSGKIDMPEPDDFLFGGLIGKANLVDCTNEPARIEDCDFQWFNGPFGFIIRDAVPVEFVALAGNLGFFRFGVKV